jgi:hypothetical protein
MSCASFRAVDGEPLSVHAPTETKINDAHPATTSKFRNGVFMRSTLRFKENSSVNASEVFGNTKMSNFCIHTRVN